MTQEQIASRYSVKKFDPNKKLNDEQLKLLEKAFHLAPSSINIQGWQMLVLPNQELKAAAAKTGQLGNKERIEEASHLLIFCRKKISRRHISRVIESTPSFQSILQRFNKSERFFKLALYTLSLFKGRHWLDNQVYLAFGFVIAACAANGIDALPMEGFSKMKLAKQLKLERSVHPLLLLAVGFAAENDKNHPSQTPKGRLPIEEVVKEL